MRTAITAVLVVVTALVARPARGQEIDAGAEIDAAPGNGLLVDPTVLALGETGPGGPLTGELAITNTEAATTVNVSGINQPDTAGCASFRLEPPAALPIAMLPAERDVWTATFTGTVLGLHECTIDILDDDGNADFVTLSATVVAPIMTVQPPVVGFGEITVGSEASQTVSISNDGTAPLTVSAVDVTGSAELTVAAPTLPLTIAARTTEILTVTYRPGAAGTDMATLTVRGDDPAHATADVALSGTGVAVTTAPHLALSPNPVDLGSAAVGSSADATVTIRNDGDQAATVSRIEITGANAAELTVEGLGCSGAQRCDTSESIAADGQLAVGLRCTPGYAGAKAGTVVVTSTASNSPTSAALRCTGTAPDIEVTPTSLGFGTTRVGSPKALTVTVRNAGNARLEYTIARIGAGGADYTVSPPCSGSCALAAGAATAHTVTFVPSAIGDRNASLTITSNDPLEPSRAVTLTGVGGGGVLTQVSPVGATLPFGDIPVGVDSSPQPVVLRNDGNLNLRLTGITLQSAAGFALTGTRPPPDVVLAPGRSHRVDVVCSPTTATSLTGSVHISSDAVAAPARTIALTCRGIMADLAATPAPVSFEPTRVGTSAVARVTIRNTGNTATTITQLAASPAAFSLENGPVLPTALAPRATIDVDVRFAPTADGDVEGTLTVTPQAGDPLAVALRGPARVASFTVEPATGDLGTVCQGQSIVQRFALTSTGSADIEVATPTLTGDGAFRLGLIAPAAGDYPALLAPSAAVTVDVTATPGPAPATGTLRFATDVATDGAVEIPLAVQAIAGGVAVSPGQIEVEAVAVGERSAPATVTLSNCAEAPLQVLDLDITGPDAASFDVGGMLPPPAIAVPVASQIRWTVVFSPERVGSHSATLTIVHAGGTLTVPLTAEASDGSGGPGGPDAGGGAGVDDTSYYACSCRVPGDSPAGGALLVVVVVLVVRRRTRASRRRT
jgi:hypothetical protein